MLRNTNIHHKNHYHPCKYWYKSTKDEAMLGKEATHATIKEIMEGSCHGSEGAVQSFSSLWWDQKDVE